MLAVTVSDLENLNSHGIYQAAVIKKISEYRIKKLVRSYRDSL